MSPTSSFTPKNAVATLPGNWERNALIFEKAISGVPFSAIGKELELQPDLARVAFYKVMRLLRHHWTHSSVKSSPWPGKFHIVGGVVTNLPLIEPLSIERGRKDFWLKELAQTRQELIDGLPSFCGDSAQPISSLGLNERALNCLMADNIQTVSELLQRGSKTLLSVPNLGRGLLSGIEKRLAAYGLALPQNPWARPSAPFDADMTKPVTTIPMRVRVRNSLAACGIKTLAELVATGENTLKHYAAISRPDLESLHASLAEYGLRLASDPNATSFKAFDGDLSQSVRILSLHQPLFNRLFDAGFTTLAELTTTGEAMLKKHCFMHLSEVRMVYRALARFGLTLAKDPKAMPVKTLSADLSAGIEVLQLGASAVQCLHQGCVFTLRELISCTGYELAKIPGIGWNRIRNIEKALARYALTLSQPAPIDPFSLSPQPSIKGNTPMENTTSEKITITSISPELLALMTKTDKGHVANIVKVGKEELTLSLSQRVMATVYHNVDTTVDLKNLKRLGKLYFNDAGQLILHESDAPLAHKATEGTMRPLVNRF